MYLRNSHQESATNQTARFEKWESTGCFPADPAELIPALNKLLNGIFDGGEVVVVYFSFCFLGYT